MAAMAAPISDPRGLHLPDELVELLDEGDGRRVMEVLGHLTDTGVRGFVTELLRSVLLAQRTGDLRTLQDTVEAWHRTLRLRDDPAFRDGLEWAARVGAEEAVSVQELADDLGLPQPRRTA